MRLVRLADQDRPEITFSFEGEDCTARAGDTVLTALLAGSAGFLRLSEFEDGPRAGFCLMGACQDCRVVVEGPREGPGGGRERVRACTTPCTAGMRVRRA